MKMMIFNYNLYIYMDSEIGWVFIYIFGFGISDFIVKKYIKKDIFYLIYYLFMGVIGFYVLKN